MARLQVDETLHVLHHMTVLSHPSFSKGIKMSFHSSHYVDVDSLLRFSIIGYYTILPIEDVIRLPAKEFDSQWMQHSSHH